MWVNLEILRYIFCYCFLISVFKITEAWCVTQNIVFDGKDCVWSLWFIISFKFYSLTDFAWNIFILLSYLRHLLVGCSILDWYGLKYFFTTLQVWYNCLLTALFWIKSQQSFLELFLVFNIPFCLDAFVAFGFCTFIMVGLGVDFLVIILLGFC